MLYVLIAHTVEHVGNKLCWYVPKERITLTLFFFKRLGACINGIYLPPVELHEHLMNPTDRMSTDEQKD